MAEIKTFGCRLNIYESEIIANNLKERDDIILFNTCAVTKEAERQAKQAIRREKKLNPNSKIIVTGCSAQINPKQYSEMSEVDKIIGNEEKLQFKGDLFNIIDSEEKIVVNDIMSVKETANHLVDNFNQTRAFLQIQNGCDHRCTFCIIPFGRGNNRSVPAGEIINNVKALVNKNYNEIVLTGVDISDYGKNLPGTPTLAQLIRRILSQTTIKRLRLSSIDVAEIDQDLFDLIANEERIMPHIHISLQAGDNMILKRMKRRHNREQVIEFCHNLRKKRDVAFGADIIAGFPTETDEMFLNSYNLIKEASIQYLHVFPFSAREGTPAAKMPQLSGQIKKERAKKLREIGNIEHKSYLSKQIGEIIPAIIEKDNIARGNNFTEIRYAGSLKVGEIYNFHIKESYDSYLVGEI